MKNLVGKWAGFGLVLWALSAPAISGPRVLAPAGVTIRGTLPVPCPARVKPAPPREEWVGLPGDYTLEDVSVRVLERDGRLVLVSLAGGTPPAPGGPAPGSPAVTHPPSAGPGSEKAKETPGRKKGERVPPPRFTGEFLLEDAGKGRFRLRMPGAFQPMEVKFRRDRRGLAAECLLGEAVFTRHFLGPESGGSFRITPRRPVEDLRREAAAATPPVETGAFATPDWVDAEKFVPHVRLDIRYATPDNFVGASFYPAARAFLQRPVTEALARAARRFEVHGLGLIIHDAYRPWSVTKMFWDATPDHQREFVADPARGSRHNRGTAVDVSLYDLSTGKPVPFPSGYDEFSPRAAVDYTGGTGLERWNRDLLRCVLETEGFKVYEAEWWHFDYQAPKPYPIANDTFEALDARGH
ncbi:MAG: M15 family metallopeptidase [Acidobacteria bacterium]|nr:M15 family metallopeptidase [Acidobacteriota bacterium]